ncbi:MAG TPA: amidohydrolase family protein [Nitrososphaeraceae archaeon]
MVSTTSISLFTVTSLLTLLLLFHVLGSAEISKDVEALHNNNNDNTAYFASNNTYTSKPSVLYCKLDGKGVVILRGATVIDGTGSVPKSNAVVIVNGSKIVNVFTAADNSKYHDYYFSRHNVNVLNLTGKYIIPGLFDMHAHVAGVLKNSYNQTKSGYMLNMLLANGITTIRNPGGPTEQSVALKQNVTAGKIKGPTIFTAGRLINDPRIPIPFVEKQVKTEQQVRQEVRLQAAIGVDYIKLYVGLIPNLVRAAIDEAHHNGLKVIGHLYLTSWTDAANLGIDALTHGVPVSPYLLPKDKQRIFIENGLGPFDHFLWFSLVNLNNSINNNSSSSGSTEINQMIKSLVTHRVPIDPTLDIYEAMLKDDKNDQYLWPKVLQLTKMMYDSGVQILSGTDIPNFGLIPGESLHHELELLAEAGINPLDVIKIATRNGANALGILNKTGTIENGKEADMIILGANPIDNISNTKKIEAIINDGKLVDRDKILLNR